MYIEAVNCTDEDGLEYFMEDEKERLFAPDWVQAFIETASSS